MPARALPEDAYLQAEIIMREERPPRGAASRGFVNLDSALALAEPDVLVYRGRRFPVEPVSAMEGLKLMQLSTRLEALAQSGAADLHTFRGLYREVLGLFARMARPGGWRGLLWRLRPNPFRDASAQEMSDISRFLFGMTMRSGVSYRNPKSPDHRSIT